ncbi:DUF4238 domain-containing protein [Arenimonas metalli]|uniref:DUF4238 domain-containing protein n=1 Tax=Arenimonas metalli CF5-1 TaxID=1384056 RepID=A0A091BQ62_9GAMM|nr:DUF4238 domain-containing protein [Arenimonas metalli]KFN46430.1 hypothetical protein N787_10395 [Arenimonas metalli CF5-1]
MTDAKIQHYVPKFLLRNFGLGKKDQVWVFDKKLGRSFNTNAKNIASESRFYDFEVGGDEHSLESALSYVETRTKPVIEKILSRDSTASLNAEERGTLAAFLSIQLLRTRAFRAQWEEFPLLLRRKVEAMKLEVAPGSEMEELIRSPSENQVKVDSARMLLRAPEDYGPHFLDKHWFVARTTPAHPFWIGDNPIALQNQTERGPYGNLGLGVPGIEIYLPLSSTRALGMWCPSLAAKFAEGAANIRTLPRHLVERVARKPDRMLAIDECLRTEGGLDYEPMTVMNFNSLQVARSERYLVSPTQDFSLAQRMISDHPEYRTGQRIVDSMAPR